MTPFIRLRTRQNSHYAMSVLILLFASLFSLGFFACIRSDSPQKLNLIDWVPDRVVQGRANQEEGPGPRLTPISIAGVEREALLTNSQTDIVSFFPCPQGATLSFYFGCIEHVNPRQQNQDLSEKVLLSISVTPEGEAVHVLFTTELSKPLIQRQWYQQQVNLGEFGGKILALRFHLESSRPGDQYALAQPEINYCGPSEDDFNETNPSPAILDDARGEPPHNLIVMLIDTVRHDAPGFNGNPRIHTPNLDRLSRRSTLITHLTSSSSWTRPAVGTLFTGLYPQLHGAEDRHDHLNSAPRTFAELCKSAGMVTWGALSNANVSSYFGFERGFDRYVLGERPDRKITEIVEQWLPTNGNERFFLYIHYGDPHVPYTVPLPERLMYDEAYEGDVDGRLLSLKRLLAKGDDRSIRDVEHLRALYEADVTRADRQVGIVTKILASTGLLDSTALVFLSDHGEEFFEHGNVTHGKDLYREVTTVPFLISLPGRSAKPILDMRLRYIDLYPTLVDLLQLKNMPNDLPGQSFLNCLFEWNRVQTPSSPRTNLLQLKLENNQSISVEWDEWKLISTFGQPLEFFNVKTDPWELSDLSGHHPVLKGFFEVLLRQEKDRIRQIEQGYLNNRVIKPPETLNGNLEAKVRENLVALGYIEGNEGHEEEFP